MTGGRGLLGYGWSKRFNFGEIARRTSRPAESTDDVDRTRGASTCRSVCILHC